MKDKIVPIVTKVITNRNSTIIEFDYSDTAVLFSYNNPVCCVIHRLDSLKRIAARIENPESKTSEKHMRDFLRIYGFSYDVSALTNTVYTSESELYELMKGE